MKRVTGVGGIFFKCNDPGKTRDWYRKHLGIQSGEFGGVFEWRLADGESEEKGHTVWNPFPKKTEYFDPGEKEFMVNYRVDDLEELLTVLEEEGVEIVGEMEEYDYGKFGWIMDPDGNKIELWEPKDRVYEDLVEKEARNKSS